MRIAKLKSAYNSLVLGTRGFGALSLRWIQFASVLPCARSSLVSRQFPRRRRIMVPLEYLPYYRKLLTIFGSYIP